MKEGDLVQLSAYGKKVQLLENLKDDVGIVVRYHFESAYVKWTNRGFRRMNRRDIKKVRV